MQKISSSSSPTKSLVAVATTSPVISPSANLSIASPPVPVTSDPSPSPYVVNSPPPSSPLATADFVAIIHLSPSI
ncbi:hypothetical protein P8452_04338 [Trifolium repens]|nr:hypothetical protein P8452_04338 [Trifolium repens]